MCIGCLLSLIELHEVALDIVHRTSVSLIEMYQIAHRTSSRRIASDAHGVPPMGIINGSAYLCGHDPEDFTST